MNSHFLHENNFSGQRPSRITTNNNYYSLFCKMISQQSNTLLSTSKSDDRANIMTVRKFCGYLEPPIRINSQASQVTLTSADPPSSRFNLFVQRKRTLLMKAVALRAIESHSMPKALPCYVGCCTYLRILVLYGGRGYFLVSHGS